ncbi:MAG: hypothetical protein JRI47_05045 [Deltaproteobacteria bacterium]|nr:hypothetical protein [Deltaproteobacteria bacterium]
MRNFARRLTLLFSAGCFGGLVNSLALWQLGNYGVTANAGIDIAPPLTPAWLYPRIVWGGLWGFLFMLPFYRQSHFLRGLLFSLGPSFVQLFVVFPFKAHDGWLGLKLGYMTPFLVLVLNALWGICVVLWLRFINERP